MWRLTGRLLLLALLATAASVQSVGAQGGAAVVTPPDDPPAVPAATAAPATPVATVAPATPAATKAPVATPAKTPAVTAIPAPNPPPPAIMPPPPTFSVGAGSPAPPPPPLVAASPTAALVVLRISGPNVSPFTASKQLTLLDSLASVMTTVTVGDMQVLLVADVYSFRRRRRLQAAALDDVQDVTVQMSAGTVPRENAVEAEVKNVVANGLLGAALQSYGQAKWGVQLISLDAAAPGTFVYTPNCTETFGSWCLDGTPFSPAGVKGIIAAGVIVFFCFLVGLIVRIDVKNRSGVMGELKIKEPAAPGAPGAPGPPPGIPAAAPVGGAGAKPGEIAKAPAGAAAPQGPYQLNASSNLQNVPQGQLPGDAGGLTQSKKREAKAPQ